MYEKITRQELLNIYWCLVLKLDPDGEIAVHVEFYDEGTKDDIIKLIYELLDLIPQYDKEAEADYEAFWRLKEQEGVN